MQWTLGKKLLLCFGIVFLCFGATLFLFRYDFGHVSDLVRTITTRDVPAAAGVHSVENNVQELFQRLLLYDRSGKEDWLERISTDKEQLREAFRTFRRDADYEGHEADAEKLRSLLDTYRSRVNDVLVAYENDNSGAVDEGIRELTDHVESLNRYLDGTVQATTTRHFTEMESRILAKIHRTERWSWGILAGSLVLSLAAVFYICLGIWRSARRLIDGARSIEEGRFDERIEVPTRDEFEDLAGAFNEMARTLRRTVVEREELEDQRERLELAKDTGGIGIWEWDLKEGRLLWDDNMTELFGVDPEDYGGFVECIHPEDRDGVYEDLVKCFEAEGVLKEEYRIYHARTGDRRWIHAKAQVTFEGDEPVSLVGTCIDMTEQKETQRRLERTVEEKETLLKEVHHRVKNNLQLIRSMIGLQVRQIEDEKLIEPLEESRNRIESMALLHENLYQSDDLAGVDLGDYLRNILRNLKASYRERSDGVRVESDLSVDSLELDRAIPCGLILNEAVSNAFEHAFEDGGGTIEIEMDRDGDRITLRVADDGRGLEEDFDYEEAESLGTRIIRRLARQQLDGSLTVQQEGGVEIQVEFSVA